MWSWDIEDDLKSCSNFLGCFPLDQLPSFPKRLPASMIINTDTSNENGDHWLGLILNKKNVFILILLVYL